MPEYIEREATLSRLESLCMPDDLWHTFAVDIAKQIITKIPAADVSPAQRWIPVTERLPEMLEQCLVVVKSKYDFDKDYEYDVDFAIYVEDDGYIEGFNTFNDWDEGQYIHISHWMPLPEPPEVDE